MNQQRRELLAAAGAAGLSPFVPAWADQLSAPDRKVLSNFGSGYILPGSGWRGFSDRVMGGISNADLDTARIEGRNCIRLTGNVTRESNGGFIQMAMYFGRNYDELDGSQYKGIEMLVYGNNEDYNLHVRTSDCNWYDQSYRATFYAEPTWSRIRIPWESMRANRVRTKLNAGRLQRIAILGWMREFDADVALAEIALYS